MMGWNFFKVYHALDLHFSTQRYDVFKYAGKTNMTMDKYNRRNDKVRFELFGDKFFNDKTAGQFCVANFIYGESDQWVYQPYADAEVVYLKWKKIRESMTYQFGEDMNKLSNMMVKHNLNAESLVSKTPAGRHPPLWQMLNAGIITLESVIILHREMDNFLDNWAKICYHDPYMEDKVLKLTKYIPFVKYEADKIQPILKGSL